MAVYLTKSMFSKLRKEEYPIYWENEQQGPSSNGDPWQRLTDGMKTRSVDLAKNMICRVCAKDGSTRLSEKIEGYVDIMSAICSISNVNMHYDDSLPKYICTECLETLKVAMAFKKSCETSDRKFKHILNPAGDPSFHSYPYSKHDFQLILHQMKLKRMKIEEKQEKERKRRERMLEKRNKKTKNKQFKCSACDINFPNKEKLVCHRRERQCMRRACELCGQLVLSIAQHMRHMHKHSARHKCPTCAKEFPVIARLKNHMLVHTNTFNFFCDLCPYKSKHKYYLVMHMRTHTGEKPYRCSQCPATFVNPSNLNKHKLTHQDKQFKCVMCEKTFRTPSALREHHEASHMNIKHTCHYCGRDFCYKSDLRKHEIRTHNRTKRDYIGGEPTYKLVERMKKMQEETEQDNMDKLSYLRHDSEQVVVSTDGVVHTYTVEHKQEFQPHAVYYSDNSVLTQHAHQHLVQPQTVQLSLPELTLKKDDVKIYETQQDINYF